jgi:hypothetical protein
MNSGCIGLGIREWFRKLGIGDGAVSRNGSVEGQIVELLGLKLWEFVGLLAIHFGHDKEIESFRGHFLLFKVIARLAV